MKKYANLVPNKIRSEVAGLIKKLSKKYASVWKDLAKV